MSPYMHLVLVAIGFVLVLGAISAGVLIAARRDQIKRIRHWRKAHGFPEIDSSLLPLKEKQ